MSRKSFYLAKRGAFWFARLVDPETGKSLTAKNTGQTDRDMASAIAAGWIISGSIPTGKQKKLVSINEKLSITRMLDHLKTMELNSSDANRIVDVLKNRGLLEKLREMEDRPLIAWLLAFYNYDTSPYVREKLAHGQSIGRTHCKDAQNRIKTYWKKKFKERNLASITRAELRDFSLELVDKKLSASTINKIMNAGKVAFAWAYREGYITNNPAEKLTTFSGRATERGILSDKETDELFQKTWNEDRVYVGNLVAATCGLRSGEVLGIRTEDIGLDRLFVRHSWSQLDGLKTPKNGESRQVPLLPHIRQKLIDLSAKNPWDDGFVFYSSIPGQPMDKKLLLNGLCDALVAIGIAKEERMSRNIVFHSWRHRYAAKMSDLVDSRSLGLATGHKTQAMLAHYADHANENHFKAVMGATEKAFGKVQ